MTEKAPERIVPSCVEALGNYQQADEDGIMVLASRQAIHETIDAYWARVGTCEALTAERDALAAEVERLREALISAEASFIEHGLPEDGKIIPLIRAALEEGKDG